MAFPALESRCLSGRRRAARQGRGAVLGRKDEGRPTVYHQGSHLTGASLLSPDL